jgi:ABC-2 type transport system permease protein
VKPSSFRRPLQIATFMRKETLDVVRQPRLLLTLVIGPFLVMAAFGVGYRDTPTPMRTLFVAPEGSPFIDQVESYADDLGSYVEYAGVSTDANDAEQQLMAGNVDLLVTFPDDPLDAVLHGDQAPIVVEHTRLDPVERTAITFASRLAIDQINGEILASIVEGGQGLTRPAKDIFSQADEASSRIPDALDRGDQQEAAAAIDELQELTAQLSVSARVTSKLTEKLGRDAGTSINTGIDDNITALRDAVAQLDPASTPEAAAGTLDKVNGLFDTVGANFDEFTTVDPSVLVQPFRSEVDVAVGDTDQVADWYAPAAIVLMLQQFGVAFGALSFVRERQLGITDVFRIAPVDATETLLGKYLAYLLIGSAIGAALTALVVTTIGVKTDASVLQLAVVMLLSLFASIGVGLVISLVSASDAQAVQYTMILLLASLFFSGFFLSVGQLDGAARVIGWLMPVTYGMRLLRDVMLRGAGLDVGIMLGLGGFGVAMFVIALFATHRQMTSAR